ncbi:MAG: dihydroorotase [Ignavibacteriales bacterium]|nr:dihydroorotase [Ignavibacteriales bacterium]
MIDTRSQPVLMQNARVIDPQQSIDQKMDLLIENGKISALGNNLVVPKGCLVEDLSGLVVAPGFVDMHVHLREPGFEHKETIESGTLSAMYGGFTAVCCMPNTNPTIDDESMVRFVHSQGKCVHNGVVDVYPVAAVTKKREGKELSAIAELVQAGAVGLSDDGAPVYDAEIMRRALEYAGMFDVPIMQHCEDPSLVRGGAMNEGFVATELGLPGMPHIAEEIMIARDIMLAEYTGSRYHVSHMSSAGSVELVRAAKKKGIRVTAEVTPHHFSLTDDAVRSFDTNTKMNPPLRTQKDIDALKEGLRDGTIDVIATDHAPHSLDEKEVDYLQAPFGIVGLETSFSLCMTELVEPGILTLAQLIEKLSVNPRRIIKKPALVKEGENAILTILDLSCRWTLELEDLHSKSKNTPFAGRMMLGKARGIVNNGFVARY